MTINMDSAMRIYDDHGQHSRGIFAIVEHAAKVTITAAMLSDMRYEIPEATDAQLWRALASALRTAGFEVIGD